MPLSAVKIAQVCHEANRGYQAVAPSLGIPVAPPWDMLPGEDRTGITQGVQGILDGKTPEESHEGWCEYKVANGWTYGTQKDAEAKTHPMLLSYDQLSEKDRMKDVLFSAIVKALSGSSE